MKKFRNTLATPMEKEDEVMDYFRTSKNNTIREMAEHFDMKESTIHAIIDRNLLPVNNGFKRRTKK